MQETKYYVLHTAEMPFDRASIDIDADGAEPGNPPIVLWSPADYGQPTDLPAEVIHNTEIYIIASMTELENKPTAIISRKLYEKLISISPELPIKKIDMMFRGPDGKDLDYCAITCHSIIEIKSESETIAGDLEWGSMVFSPSDNKDDCFELRSSGILSHLIISETIASKLNSEEFRDIELSEFRKC